MTTETGKQISLRSTHNGANKIYQVHLAQVIGGWVVNYAHAGVGKPLHHGTKTKAPVLYAKALKTFESLISEKVNGDSHYFVDGDQVVAHQDVPVSKEMLGIIPQQPTAINAKTLAELIDNPSWGIQIKANGENRVISVNTTGQVKGGNKLGHLVPLPLDWVEQAKMLGSFTANGEHIGNELHLFDLMNIDGVDIRHLPQSLRMQRLVQLLEDKGQNAPFIKLLPCVYDGPSKRKVIEHAKNAQLEGLVAKRAAGPYTQGRSQDSLKFVFREVATCIVIAQNDKRSVAVGLLDAAGTLVNCGNVTIPANRSVPDEGALVDVQFMYYNGKSFEIPVYDPNAVSPRADVLRTDCTFAQVTRFKPQDQFAALNTTPAAFYNPVEITGDVLNETGDFIVSLESVGNPDRGQDPENELPGVKNIQKKVTSLAQAAKVCRDFIRSNELGGGNWSGGLVTRQEMPVARVSYNSRVWEPQ